MNDREMLEFAAKAAGYNAMIEWDEDFDCMTDFDGFNWNPLKDSEDAFDLAILLSMQIEIFPAMTSAVAGFGPHTWSGNDRADNTRRAIVSAAAYIGKGM